MSDEDGKLIIFGRGLAIGYLVFGLLEMLGGLGLGAEWLGSLYVQGSVMDGFVLLVIGAVFAFGWREREEGPGFMLVGMALGIIFLIIYLILMGADLLSLLIFGSEHVEGWTIMDGVRPGLYLGAVSAVGGLIWRKRLSLARLSRAGA